MDQNLVIYFSIGFISAIIMGFYFNKCFAPLDETDYLTLGFFVMISLVVWPAALIVAGFYLIGRLLSIVFDKFS
jgi:hypothetical protein